MRITYKNHEFREKLSIFAVKIIKLTKLLPKTQENAIISKQVIRSATSIGANYAESMLSLTKPDFIHCLNICKKETAETLHWLQLLSRLNSNLDKKILPLFTETETYLKIFISSVKTAQKKTKSRSI